MNTLAGLRGDAPGANGQNQTEAPAMQPDCGWAELLPANPENPRPVAETGHEP